MKQKYYHCSPRRIPVGTVLSGHNTASGLRLPKCSNYIGGPAVFMTNSPKPHYTIAPEAKEEGWYIYKVDPIGKVDISDDWDEFVCSAARIEKCLRRVKKSDSVSAVRKRDYADDNWSDEYELKGFKFNIKTVRR